MDELTLIVVVGAAAGGLVQGIAGFGFGLMALAFWAWIVSPQLAGPMVVFGSLVGQILALRTARRGFELRRVLPFILGGLCGSPIGVLLVREIDPTSFRFAVGLMLTIYCPIVLFARNLPRIQAGGRAADAAAGLVGGVMGGLGGLTGPAPTLWCVLRGWDRDVQRAIFQSFNLSMQAVTLAGYAVTGVLTARTWHMFALIVPTMLVPTFLGTVLYSRFSEMWFRRLVLALLTLSGVVLLSASVPAMIAEL